MLYTLPARVFVVASVVYTSRSSFVVASAIYTSQSCFHGRICCIHCPLIGFVVLTSLHMLALASIVYTTCSCSAFRNLLTLFVFENDFISKFRHFGAGMLRSINYSPAQTTALNQLIKRIPRMTGAEHRCLVPLLTTTRSVLCSPC